MACVRSGLGLGSLRFLCPTSAAASRPAGFLPDSFTVDSFPFSQPKLGSQLPVRALVAPPAFRRPCTLYSLLCPRRSLQNQSRSNQVKGQLCRFPPKSLALIPFLSEYSFLLDVRICLSYFASTVHLNHVPVAFRLFSSGSSVLAEAEVGS